MWILNSEEGGGQSKNASKVTLEVSSAPTEQLRAHVREAGAVCRGLQEARLLNEGDTSGHNPIFGCFLQGKWLIKQLLMFPLGHLSEHFS